MAEATYYGTGRRKTSVARVRLVPGQGNITINGRDLKDYFDLATLELIIKQPLELTGTTSAYDVIANVQGGGRTGSEHLPAQPEHGHTGPGKRVLPDPGRAQPPWHHVHTGRAGIPALCRSHPLPCSGHARPFPGRKKTGPAPDPVHLFPALSLCR